MFRFLVRPLAAVLAIFLLSPAISSQSLIDEGLREFEELRLRQLQTVQSDGELTAFSSDGCSGNLSRNWQL
ncbi:MAG: hypothetical protein GY792_19970, partial [Gammaproteobacteria bacterium]|nr:hypothetical protein [Gammaproteobacteria bacterium]